MEHKCNLLSVTVDYICILERNIFRLNSAVTRSINYFFDVVVNLHNTPPLFNPLSQETRGVYKQNGDFTRCAGLGLCRTPPCCTHPLPLNRSKAGREERQKRKRGKGGMGLLLSFKVKKKYRSEKFSRHPLKQSVSDE